MAEKSGCGRPENRHGFEEGVGVADNEKVCGSVKGCERDK